MNEEPSLFGPYKKFVQLGLFLIVALVLGIAWGARGGVRTGTLAPTFTRSTLEGTTVSLEDLRGKVVVIDFWATWCPPCVASMPVVEAMAEEFAGQDVAIIGISADQDVNALRRFMESKVKAYPIISDPQGEILTAYEVEAIPTFVVIDKAGVVRSIGHDPSLSDTIREYL